MKKVGNFNNISEFFVLPFLPSQPNMSKSKRFIWVFVVLGIFNFGFPLNTQCLATRSKLSNSVSSLLPKDIISRVKRIQTVQFETTMHWQGNWKTMSKQCTTKLNKRVCILHFVCNAGLFSSVYFFFLLYLLDKIFHIRLANMTFQFCHLRNCTKMILIKNNL